MARIEFFELLKKSNLSRTEQKRLFRSIRKSIILFHLGRRQYERDRIAENIFQNEVFEKIIKSDAKEFKKLIYRLKLDEIDFKLDASKKKTPAHILERFILEQKAKRFEKFLGVGWRNKDHFQKVAHRYRWKLNRVEEKKSNGKNWKKGLIGIGVAALLGAGVTVIYKKITEKKEGEK